MYNRDLLRLALRLAEQARLADPHGSAERRSRACGSVVIADVRMGDAQVAAFGQDVRACAVGQGSAAILGAHIVGMSRDDVAQAHRQLSDYLSGLSEALPDWPGLELLKPVRELPARHAAALLPYEAALAAIDKALSVSRNAATSAN